MDGAGGIFGIWKRQLPEFKLHYNVLVIALKEKDAFSYSVEELNLDTVSNAILRVLDENNIDKTHLLGFSLGTIFTKHFALKYPKQIHSIILAGAITKINSSLRILFKAQNMLKSVFSYATQFRIFSNFLLPNRNHKETRLFIKDQSTNWDEAEFLKWAGFTKKLNPVLNYLYSEPTDTPSLFIMGEEDRLFLPAVKKVASSKSDSLLFIIQDCGHIVNMEQPVLFNRMVIGYLTGLEQTLQIQQKGVLPRKDLMHLEKGNL